MFSKAFGKRLQIIRGGTGTTVKKQHWQRVAFAFTTPPDLAVGKLEITLGTHSDSSSCLKH